MDRGSGDIGRGQGASDPDHVPPRRRPGPGKASRENPRAGCTPDFIRLDGERARRMCYCLDHELGVDTERHEGGSRSLAIFASTSLNDRQVTRLDGDDLGAEARCLKRSRMRTNAMRHEDRALLPSCRATVASAVCAPPSAGLA